MAALIVALIIVGIVSILSAIFLAWRQLWRTLKRMDKRNADNDLLLEMHLKDLVSNHRTAELPPAVGEELATVSKLPRRHRHLYVVKVLAPVLGALGVLVIWLRGQWHTAAGVAAMMSVAGVLITASGPAPAHPEPTLPEATQPAPATTVPLMLPTAPPPPVAVTTAPGTSNSPRTSSKSPVILTATATHLIPDPPLPTLNNPLTTTTAPPSTQCTITVLGNCVPLR